MSVLDSKPQRFLDFEAMLADPNWLQKLGSSVTDAEQELLIAAMDHIIAHGEASEKGPETAIAGKIDDDKLLLHSIIEFNSALYEGDREKEPEPRFSARGVSERPNSAALHDPSIRLLRRPMPKKVNPVNSLEAIKYKSRKNPAVLNVSTVEFQKMLSRFNMGKKPSESTGRLTLGPDGRSTFASSNPDTQSSERSHDVTALQGLDKDQLIQMLLAERGVKAVGVTTDPVAAIAGTPRVGSASGPGARQTNAMTRTPLPPLPEGDQLKLVENVSTDSKNQEFAKANPSQVAAANVSSHPVRPASGSLLQNNAADALVVARPQTANGLLAPLKLPLSPIKSARGSRPSSGLLSLSADSGTAFVMPVAANMPSGASSPLMSVQKAGNKLPTPRIGSASDGMSVLSKSASMPNLSHTSHTGSKPGSRQSATLNKLSITGTQGNTFSLSKPRLKEIRALRDHLMSTSGTFTLNVNPESSPDAQQEVQESIAVTKDMVRETMAKNKVDQIQSLIETPGYYEAVGPADIFKSDVHQNFQFTPAFENAVKAADVTKGIKRDELRVWSEDGIKNKIKIFAAGGSMKM